MRASITADHPACIVTHAVAGRFRFDCLSRVKLKIDYERKLAVAGICKTAVHHSRLQSNAQMAAEVTPDLFVNVTSTGPSLLPSIFVDRKLPDQLSLRCSSSLRQRIMLVPLSTSNLPHAPTHWSLEAAVLAAPTRLLPLLAALAPADGYVDVQPPAAAKLAHTLSGQTRSGGQQHTAKHRPMKVCRRRHAVSIFMSHAHAIVSGNVLEQGAPGSIAWLCVTVTPVHTQASGTSGFAVVVKTRMSEDRDKFRICGAIVVRDCLSDAVDRHGSQVRSPA